MPCDGWLQRTDTHCRRSHAASNGREPRLVMQGRDPANIQTAPLPEKDRRLLYCALCEHSIIDSALFSALLSSFITASTSLMQVMRVQCLTSMCFLQGFHFVDGPSVLECRRQVVSMTTQWRRQNAKIGGKSRRKSKDMLMCTPSQNGILVCHVDVGRRAGPDCGSPSLTDPGVNGISINN